MERMNWDADLQPSKKHPYYIVVNAHYTPGSAGIRILHLLCHHLNMNGYEAYLTSSARQSKHANILYNLMNPFLTKSNIKAHLANKRYPIMVFPESIQKTDKVKGPIIVNYLLHYHDAWDFKMNKIDKDGEIYFGYSKLIVEHAGTGDVFTIPMTKVSDYIEDKEAKRKGKLVYGFKFKLLGGKFIPGVHDDAIEILNHHPKQQSKAEVIKLLQSSEVLYVYEDTALIIEAILCGCPVVFIPNDVFPYKKTILAKEIGDYGISYDFSPSGLEHAKKTIHIARENYLKLYDNIWPQFDNFVKKTQEFADKKVITDNITEKDYDGFLKNFDIQKNKLIIFSTTIATAKKLLPMFLYIKLRAVYLYLFRRK